MTSRVPMEYHILPAKLSAQPEQRERLNAAFELWWKVWREVYSQGTFELSSEEFLRHDLVCLITANGEVAGLHLYSFYSLDYQADLSSRYFRFFSEDYKKKLIQRNVSGVMSMEYLTVNPKYRSQALGLSLGRLLIHLGTRLFENTSADAIVAPARRDLKVHEMAYENGFACLEQKVLKRGFECDMIAYFKGNLHSPESLPTEICESLWQQKNISNSCLRFFHPEPVRKLKIAG